MASSCGWFLPSASWCLPSLNAFHFIQVTWLNFEDICNVCLKPSEMLGLIYSRQTPCKLASPNSTETGYSPVLMAIDGGLDPSPPLIILKNKTDASSTVDTGVINFATSLSCHTTATARPETIPLIMSKRGCFSPSTMKVELTLYSQKHDSTRLCDYHILALYHTSMSWWLFLLGSHAQSLMLSPLRYRCPALHSICRQ